jgi:hypothetical protein
MHVSKDLGTLRTADYVKYPVICEDLKTVYCQMTEVFLDLIGGLRRLALNLRASGHLVIQ